MPNIYDDLMDSTSKLVELNEMMVDPDIDEEALADTISAVMADFTDSAEVFGKIIRNASAQAAALKEEENRIKAKRMRCEKNVERLQETIKMVMLATGQNKVKTNLFSFSIRKNTAVVIDDLAVIPLDYLRVFDPEPDKVKIKEFLKAGNTADFAHLEETQSLSIR